MTDPRITKGLELLAAYEANWSYAAEKDFEHWMWVNTPHLLRDLPARVAELEEGLIRLNAELDAMWNDPSRRQIDEFYVQSITNAQIACASLLEGKAGETACDGPYTPITLSGSTASPTPPDAGDDVERVARVISPYLMRSYSGTNPDADDQAAGRDTALHVAGLALSAIRPSVDDAKIAEIRARHDYCAHVATKTEWEDQHAWMAHDDRAALLAMLDGGRDG